MAARDTAAYISACLDSIRAQTYPHWELIAINDHSRDETPEILQAYAEKDDRIQVVHSVREKLIPALKEGYPQATGDLVNRMDSDDMMPADKLETLVGEWLKYGKGHVIAGGTEHFVDHGLVGNGFRRYEQWLNEIARENRHYEEIYQECVIPSHSWIIHRDDFDRVGGFEPEVYPEDYDLCFRFYHHQLKVVGIDKVLHHWRDRSNRISRTWEEYADNRYYDLKLRYFYSLDRNPGRPLVIWGGGKNGKDLVKKIQSSGENQLHWVCENPNKIGHNIYGIIMQAAETVAKMGNPQVLIAVANTSERAQIRQKLLAWGKAPVKDFWFFS